MVWLYYESENEFFKFRKGSIIEFCNFVLIQKTHRQTWLLEKSLQILKMEAVHLSIAKPLQLPVTSGLQQT